MRLYKVNNSPYWQFNVTWNGRRERKSTRRADKDQAQEVALSYLKRLQDRDQLGARESITLGQLISVYLPRVKAEGLADYRNIESRCRKLIGEPPFQEGFSLDRDTPVESLTTADVVRLRTELLRTGAKAGTVNHMLRTLRRLVNVADEMEYAVPQRIKFELLEERENTRWLSAAECQRLLDELDPARTLPGFPAPGQRTAEMERRLTDQYELVVLLMDSGLRYGELTSMRWADVDTETFRTLHVWRSKTSSAGRIDLPDRSANILRGRYERHGTVQYLFPGFDVRGNHLNRPRSHSTSGIVKAMERAGLNTPESIKRHGRCTVHSLRHTFASTLVQNGATLFEVQSLLGHTGPAMTKRYAVLEASSTAAKAREILNRVHQKAL